MVIKKVSKQLILTVLSFNNFSNPFVLCPLFLSIVQYQKTFVFLYRIFALCEAFLPSPEMLNIRKQRRFFKPINTLSTNRLHSISVSSGIKKTTSYWYHQKKDYFCIIKRTFICILLCQNTSDNQALTKPSPATRPKTTSPDNHPLRAQLPDFKKSA